MLWVMVIASHRVLTRAATHSTMFSFALQEAVAAFATYTAASGKSGAAPVAAAASAPSAAAAAAAAPTSQPASAPRVASVPGLCGFDWVILRHKAKGHWDSGDASALPSPHVSWQGAV